MSGGPNDGGPLYPEDRTPCLVCGRVVNYDWDGYVVWHGSDGSEVPPDALLLELWCAGSRTDWTVPA